MAKIQGTFECLSTIQLWMTPKRDFGVFFPILHIVLLTSIEFTGYLAAWFAYDMHWTYMYWFVALAHDAMGYSYGSSSDKVYSFVA